MPSDDRLGSDDGEYLGPVRPDPGQQNPEESVALLQMRAFDRALQDSDLLPQCEILEGQVSVGCQDGNQGSEQRLNHAVYRIGRNLNRFNEGWGLWKGQARSSARCRAGSGVACDPWRREVRIAGK